MKKLTIILFIGACVMFSCGSEKSLPQDRGDDQTAKVRREPDRDTFIDQVLGSHFFALEVMQSFDYFSSLEVYLKGAVDGHRSESIADILDSCWNVMSLLEGIHSVKPSDVKWRDGVVEIFDIKGLVHGQVGKMEARSEDGMIRISLIAAKESLAPNDRMEFVIGPQYLEHSRLRGINSFGSSEIRERVMTIEKDKMSYLRTVGNGKVEACATIDRRDVDKSRFKVKIREPHYEDPFRVVELDFDFHPSMALPYE